jgi:hypothetical protein
MGYKSRRPSSYKSSVLEIHRVTRTLEDPDGNTHPVMDELSLADRIARWRNQECGSEDETFVDLLCEAEEELRELRARTACPDCHGTGRVECGSFRVGDDGPKPLYTACSCLTATRQRIADLERQLVEARARYHTDVDGAISARLAAEDAFREQEQYARDRFALFDISHKDTVHGLLDIARRALATTKEPTDD